MVEPVDPFKGSKLDSLERAPRPAPMDQLSLEQPDDGLGKSVVVAVTDAADGRLDAGFRQAFGVFDRDVLNPAVAVMDQAAATRRSPVVKRLLQRIEHETRLRRAGDPPADDAAC